MSSELFSAHPPALIARIMEIVLASPRLASPFRTVHYTGGADEGLLRALLAERPRLEVSAMDMPNRWGSTTRYFWVEFENYGMKYPEVPNWLEGMPFFQEGAHDHDVGLYDWPWHHRREFSKMVAFSGRRPPRLVLLFGQSGLVKTGEKRIWEDSELKLKTRDVFEEKTISHPAYEWETLDGLHVGRWKPGIFSAFEKRQRKREADALRKAHLLPLRSTLRAASGWLSPFGRFAER